MSDLPPSRPGASNPEGSFFSGLYPADRVFTIDVVSNGERVGHLLDSGELIFRCRSCGNLYLPVFLQIFTGPSRSYLLSEKLFRIGSFVMVQDGVLCLALVYPYFL